MTKCLHSILEKSTACPHDMRSSSAKRSEGITKRLPKLLRQAALLIPLTATAGVATASDLVLDSVIVGNPSQVRASEEVNYEVSLRNSLNATTAENVVLTINLPGTAEYIGHSVAGSTDSCSHNSGVLTCNLDDIPYSVAVDTTVNVQTRITASTPNSVTYSSNVAASTETAGTNDQGSRNVSVASGTDLEMLLTGDASVMSGGVVTYVASIENHGPDTAPSPRAVITLSPDVTRTGGLPAGCTQSNQVITCTSGTALSNGNTWSIGNITAIVTPSSGNVSTTGSASFNNGTGFDGISSNNTKTVLTEATPGSDLRVEMTRVGSGTIVQFDTVQVRLRPIYSGQDPSNLSMVATIDSSFGIQQAPNFTQNGWNCAVAGQQITCSRTSGGGGDNVANYQIGDVLIDLEALSSGANLQSNTVVSSGGLSPDAIPSNDTATLALTVAAPSFNLQGFKTGPSVNESLRVVNGETFTYRLRARNDSNIPFRGELRMTDTLPAGIEVTAINANGWACTPSTTPVTGSASIVCNRDYSGTPLASGTNAPDVTLTARVVTEGGPYQNQMCVSYHNVPAGVVYPTESNGDATSGDNCQTHTGVSGYQAVDSADLSVAKTASPASVAAGEVLTYTLELVNAGTANATNVTLSDAFPDLFTGHTSGQSYLGATLLSSGNTTVASLDDICGTSHQSGNAGSHTLNCTFPTVPVCTQGSDCARIEIQVRPLGNTSNADPLTRVNNEACAYSASTADSDFSNNCGSASSEITAKADISVVKTAAWLEDPEPIAAGTNLTYTITVRNPAASSASGAANVELEETLPEDVTFVSATPTVGSCSAPTSETVINSGNNTFSCDLGTLARNASQTVEVVVRPNHGTQGNTLQNDVAVSTDTPEWDSTNNTSFATTDVAVARVDLVSTQRDNESTLGEVAIGDEVVYTLRTVNRGPSVAEDVKLYTVLPTSGLSFVRFEYEDANNGNAITPGLPAGVSCTSQPNPGDFGKTTDRVNELFFTASPDPIPDPLPTLPGALYGRYHSDLENADIVCDVADLLAVNDSVEFRMVLKGEEAGTFEPYTIARSLEHRAGIADIVPANDFEPENTTVKTEADLTVLEKTASATQVSVFEPFNYLIRVGNNGPAEGLGVKLTDSLPANMELVGAVSITAITSGTASNQTCTGVTGETTFECDFGDVSSDFEATVVVPVRLTAGSGTITNTAEVVVTGNTIDTDSDNNEAEGPVDVVKSSLAGRVYHDNDDSGNYTSGTNPAIAGVTVNLTGTDAFKNPVSRSTTTDGNGEYLFTNLAPGNYTVTEQHPASWIDAEETAGSEGGNIATNDVISDITLPANTDATEYNFGELRDLGTGTVTASISGHVYHDRNNNGVFDTDEAPIAGVTVRLEGNGNGDVRTTTTNTSGYYAFSGLEPGVEYTVTEEQPSGWVDGRETAGSVFTDSANSNDVFVVNVGDDEHGEEWNFGERRSSDLTPTAIPVMGPFGLLLTALLLGLIAMLSPRIRRQFC
ncbi:SdrD B-like domain-containing protein [Marinobacterium iners]|uniref:Conserved repeat domain-containing protein n=1 Tax=Marinobacterium iners DSM 11526 TaxID=1122198 RepID=A0A1H4G764_9GAMM|nr:SdrD B-like domain-containing protein [Marinobacterium iners]SEB05267.1 conserved repeat domain-containing protein [Marinobacterium iners DSM 11526]